MTRDRRRSLCASRAGFSMAELLVVCAIFGILASASVPFFLRYYQTAALRTATEELASFLNQGRQIAIKVNQPVCTQTAAGSIRFRINGCAGTIWLGPNTDASGNLKVPAGFTLGSSADPIFNYLGAATPAATYTVTQATTGRTLRVTVAATGRVLVVP
ncbi:MAG TPA: GspH/FimT family pseudopilin [Candidatus Limnocylindrales bacterium]|nr:GspH/FimT family pseudopilin [Candidatus Limnocylindrales bacterium]